MGLRVKWLLDGLWFNDGTDGDGAQWTVEAEEGWSGSPANADTARIISLRGWVWAPDWETRRRAEHRLAALCLDPARPDRLWELRCTEETGDLSAWVRRDAAPIVTIRPGGSVLDWTLQLRAPDPRKYGVPRSLPVLPPQSSGGLPWTTGLDWSTGLSWGTVVSTGSVVLANPGYADAPVRFVVSGSTVPGESLVNPRISAPQIDGLLRYNDTLTTAAGAVPWVEIDTNPRRRTVRLGGTADRRARAAGSRWFTVPARSELLVAFAADSMPATALLTAYWSTAQW
ncbi:hypothetical protein ACVDFE_02085 [Lentzea chajnantorensis]